MQFGLSVLCCGTQEMQGELDKMSAGTFLQKYFGAKYGSDRQNCKL
jgi:hypothetical protein